LYNERIRRRIEKEKKKKKRITNLLILQPENDFTKAWGIGKVQRTAKFGTQKSRKTKVQSMQPPGIHEANPCPHWKRQPALGPPTSPFIDVTRWRGHNTFGKVEEQSGKSGSVVHGSHQHKFRGKAVPSVNKRGLSRSWRGFNNKNLESQIWISLLLKKLVVCGNWRHAEEKASDERIIKTILRLR
jgi:hypothetical protein